MKSPNKFIIIVFILSILYLLYEAIPFLKNKKIIPNKMEGLEAITNNLHKDSEEGTRLDKQEKNMEKEHKKQALIWGRNPFVSPKDMDSINKPSTSSKQVSATPKSVNPSPTKTFKLTAIIGTTTEKAATINQAPYVVKIGDLINNEKVLKIKDDRIILGRNGKTRTVLLENIGVSFKK